MELNLLPNQYFALSRQGQALIVALAMEYKEESIRMMKNIDNKGGI